MSPWTIRWSYTKGFLEVTDPWGEVHLISATQENIPRWWKREAGERLAADKLQQAKDREKRKRQ